LFERSRNSVNFRSLFALATRTENQLSVCINPLNRDFKKLQWIISGKLAFSFLSQKISALMKITICKKFY